MAKTDERGRLVQVHVSIGRHCLGDSDTRFAVIRGKIAAWQSPIIFGGFFFFASGVTMHSSHLFLRLGFAKRCYRLDLMMLLAGIVSLSCAHRSVNEVDARTKSVMSKSESGNRYIRKALYLHQLPEREEFAGRRDPFFCAYVIVAEEVKLESGRDFVKNAIAERQGDSISLTAPNPNQNAKYQIAPLNITKELELHYGFNRTMMLQGMNDARVLAKKSKVSDLFKIISGTVAAMFQGSAAIWTLVTQRQNSFDESQIADMVSARVSDVTELKKACALDSNMAEAQQVVQSPPDLMQSLSV
jgi:hypothetical protein